MGKIKKKDQGKETLTTVALNGDFVIETYQHDRDPHPGDLCLRCRSGYLDYDGLLNLVCQQCGYTLVGCST